MLQQLCPGCASSHHPIAYIFTDDIIMLEYADLTELTVVTLVTVITVVTVVTLVTVITVVIKTKDAGFLLASVKQLL